MGTERSRASRRRRPLLAIKASSSTHRSAHRRRKMTRPNRDKDVPMCLEFFTLVRLLLILFFPVLMIYANMEQYPFENVDTHNRVVEDASFK